MPAVSEGIFAVSPSGAKGHVSAHLTFFEHLEVQLNYRRSGTMISPVWEKLYFIFIFGLEESSRRRERNDSAV
jgi:hypothetical protein